ncbi:MAG: MFS transporter, partial [Betaproteobacteria bacterium]|nr:MFS transporter [Betaproteobacteria bacterium]
MPLFFTPLKETFGWSSAAIAFAFSLNRIEGSVLTPIEGWLADKYGPRKMIMIGALFMGLGFIVLGMIDTIWSFYVAMLIVAGGSSATMGVPRSWAITQWFRRLRGRAMGVGNVGGVFAGPLLVPVVWLLTLHGWRTTFFVLGVCTIVVCVPLAAVYRRRPEDYGLLPDGDPAASDGPLADAGSQVL